MDSKNNGIHPLKEPLILKEDNSPEDKLAEVNHDKENDHAKLPVRQSLTGNMERDRTRNLKDVNFRPKQEDNSPNEFAKDGMDGKTSSNEVGARKGLFRFLTLKSRRFRQEPASFVEKSEKPGVITERNRKAAKTEPIDVPSRKAASCDNLSCLLSSPKDGDFECIKNINKYLEVQEKLKKAQARIAYLENQRSDPTDEDTMTQDTAKSAPATQDQELRFVRENNKRRTKKDVKIQRNVQLNQVLSFKEKSKKSFSLKKGGRASSTSRLLDGPEFTPLLDKDPGDSTDDGVFINETERRLKITHDPQAFTTPDHDCDGGYVLLSPLSIWGHPLPKTIPPVSCFTARNDTTAVKEGEDHSYDVDKKRALRKNILEVPWTEEEWTELTELVRYEMNQRQKRQMVSYTNWPLNGRQSNLLAEQSDAHNSSHQEDNRRNAMVFSENLNIQVAANEQLLQGQQRLMNDPQLLVHRSVGRRPVPTPRRRRASLQASSTASNLEEMLL